MKNSKYIFIIFYLLVACTNSNKIKDNHIDENSEFKLKRILSKLVVDSNYFEPRNTNCMERSNDSSAIKTCYFRSGNNKIFLNQILVEKNRTFCVKVNDTIVKMNEIILDSNMQDFPSTVETIIDCNDIHFFEIETNHLYLIKFVPMNWTGLMTNFSIYILVDIRNLQALSTISGSFGHVDPFNTE